MNEIAVVGLSHRTAPVELRERLSTATSDLAAEVVALRDAGLEEALVLSTCNRVEIYAAGRSAHDVVKRVRAHLEQRAEGSLAEATYEHVGEEAVRHAFRVAASLDSLVVGEPQILGQVKQAFDAATGAEGARTLLSRCFTRAFAVAKRVRSETGIAEGTVSVSSIAVELARSIFGELSGRRVLLLGAGEMGEAAAKSLADRHVVLRVVNRSTEKALALAARCGGEARDYELLASELVKADVVISSTSTPGFVLTEELMRDVVRARRHRPLFLIDIAVPRDVDPRVGALEGVFLYDVDDLQSVAEANLRSRRAEAEAAERIVAVEVAEFEQWRRSLELAPTIVALRERHLAVVRAELEKTVSKLHVEPADRAALERMGEAIVGKLLHPALHALKSAEEDRDALVAAARRLYELDRPREDPSPAGAEGHPRGATAPVPTLDRGERR